MTRAKRYLIAKEIELGFLNIPPSLKKYFPKTKGKLSFVIGDRKKQLAYNPRYHRVFGLTKFYRDKNASPKDVVEIKVLDKNQYKLTFEKSTEKEKSLSSITTDEAKEIIDIAELPSQIKGNVVEERIGHLILLYGQGLLNVYKPISDIEGIDLVIIKKGIFQPIFIQVKSRYNLRGNNLQFGIKCKDFNPHHTFYIIGAYFDPQKMDLHDYLVFMPSENFQKEASVINRGKDNAKYVLTAPLSPDYSGRYAKYIIKKENLVNKIFEKFKEIEKYLK